MADQNFLMATEKMAEIHKKKSSDYASSDNPYSNFDVSEYIIGLFNSNRDKTFMNPIATKIARLATLLNSGKPPENESVEDSFVDIANYFLLWMCDLKRRIIPAAKNSVDASCQIIALEPHLTDTDLKQMLDYFNAIQRDRQSKK